MRRLLPLLALLALLVGALLVVDRLRAPVQYTLEAGSREIADEVFASDIRKFGGKEAYERLARAIRDLSVGDQHVYAHAFGHQLYEIEGEGGIAVCDNRFGMGCLHQLLGDAISDLGTEAIPRLHTACTRIMGGQYVCMHGLGHGIVSSTGYGVDDLQRALDLCGMVSTERKYSGCEGGAFMEYNMRIIARTEGILGDRVPDPNGMYAPCDSVADEYKKICLFWQPQWWLYDVFRVGQNRADISATYKKTGRLCASAEYPQSCYEGLGYLTPSIFAYNPADVRAACDMLGDSQGARVYCRGTAAIMFRIESDSPELAATMCDSLMGRAYEVCQMYTKSGRDFSFSAEGYL